MTFVLGVPIDLTVNEVRNALFQSLPAEPAAVAGRFYLNTAVSPYMLRYNNGDEWVDIGPAGALVGALDDLSDVAIAAAGAGKVLAYDSGAGAWVDTTVASLLAAASLSDLGPPTADVDLGGFRAGGALDPVAGTDLATKAYVDAVAQGLKVKPAVRAASAGADVDLASAPAVLDGVSLAPGDRLLVKDQADPAGNGIRVFTAAGAPLERAADMDTSAGAAPGSFTFVTEGTAGHDTGWVMTADAPIVLGTTALGWAQFSAAGDITAGAGLTRTGSTVDAVGTAARLLVTADAIDIDPGYAGQASITILGIVATGTWEGDPVDIAHGGTGATSAAAARAALGVSGKYETDFGDGVAASFTISHGLGTKGVSVVVRNIATGDRIYTNDTATTTDDVVIGFTSPPASASHRVSVFG